MTFAAQRLTSPHISSADTTAQPAPWSRPEVVVQNVGNVAHLRAIDGYEFRQWFAPKFAEFLKSRFANPELVAVTFNVRTSTAWNWWNGDHRASGDTVARCFLLFPQAVSWFLGEWERRS